VAAAVLSALACVNHARYGTYADTKDSALGPCQAPACTSASTSLISSATEVYTVLNEVHAPAHQRVNRCVRNRGEDFQFAPAVGRE